MCAHKSNSYRGASGGAKIPFLDSAIEEWLCALADALRLAEPGADVLGMKLQSAVSAGTWADLGFDNGLRSNWCWCADEGRDEAWPFAVQEIGGEKGYFPVAGRMRELACDFARWYRGIKHFPAPAQAADMPLLARYLFLQGVRDRRGNPERQALRPWTMRRVIAMDDDIRRAGRAYYDAVSDPHEGAGPLDWEVIVERDGMQLKKADFHTGMIDSLAVKQNAMALPYVGRQTPEICWDAVRGNWRSLEYVESQTPELVARACVENPRAMALVRDQNRDVCEAGIRANPESARYIRKENRLEDLCILADDLKRGVLCGIEIVPVMRARREGWVR